MFNDFKQILSDLLASADSTGCSPDLTVVSNNAVEQLRKWHGENALDRDDVYYELTSNLDGNASEQLHSRNYLDAVEEAFEALQHHVSEWDKETEGDGGGVNDDL